MNLDNSISYESTITELKLNIKPLQEQLGNKGTPQLIFKVTNSKRKNSVFNEILMFDQDKFSNFFK